MIHCTDPDQKACQHVVEKIVYSSLYREGTVKFNRPSIPTLVDKNRRGFGHTKPSCVKNFTGILWIWYIDKYSEINKGP
jgi:hypothetical protein